MKSDSSITTALLEQLSVNSTPYVDPINRIDWEALNLDAPWLPESAISLYGVPEFVNTPVEQRIKLSQYELLHLLEIGLWFESLFMSRLCDSARVNTDKISLATYHLHELREEAGHGLLFFQLVKRSGLERVVPDKRHAKWFEYLRKRATLDSSLFWAACLMAEELLDRMHRTLLHDSTGICPTIQKVIRVYTIDRARHITHAKCMVETMIKPLNRWQKWKHQLVLRRVFNQFVRLLYFPSAESYDLAGLMPGCSWAALAWNNQLRHQYVRQQLETTMRPLKQNGIVLDWYKR